LLCCSEAMSTLKFNCERCAVLSGVVISFVGGHFLFVLLVFLSIGTFCTQENAQSHLHALFFSTLNSCVYEGKKRGTKTKQTDQKTVPNSLPYRQQQFQSRARKLGLKYGKYKPNSGLAQFIRHSL